MIDFARFLLIILSIFFLLIFVSLMVTDGDAKFVTIFMSCWFTTVFLLLIINVFNGGAN